MQFSFSSNREMSGLLLHWAAIAKTVLHKATIDTLKESARFGITRWLTFSRVDPDLPGPQDLEALLPLLEWGHKGAWYTKPPTKTSYARRLHAARKWLAVDLITAIGGLEQES